MEETLTIHKVIHGGKGLGSLNDGMVVMVPGCLPGEVVTVRETSVHRGYKEARLIRIEQAAPERVIPPCPVYGLCGGCNLQHAHGAAQLRIKHQILRESLLRAGLDLADSQPHPTLPAPIDFGYRHRIRLHIDAKGGLGFHQATSNTVVPIRRCLLATDPMNRILEALVDDLWPQRFTGRIREVELLHSPIDDRIILVLHPLPEAREAELSDLAAALGPLTACVLARRGTHHRHDRDQVKLGQHFRCLGLNYRLQWDPECFFQVNATQNPRLIELALGALAPLPPASTALDLFCGMGNFSIPLALLGTRVTGIEHNRRSIRWATTNSRDNDLHATHFIAADVAAHLNHLSKARKPVDCILLDPPRQGLGKAAVLLADLRPQRIVAVSCDPATQARDLARIINNGYRLVHITGVDMFPQTHHIESVALLERN